MKKELSLIISMCLSYDMSSCRNEIKVLELDWESFQFQFLPGILSIMVLAICLIINNFTFFINFDVHEFEISVKG